MQELEKLLQIMADLRDPTTGCPWDTKQDFKSIAAYTVEEAYEVADAIERNDLSDLKGELGDLLFHVAFHSRMAEEIGEFDFSDVVATVNEKLIQRHPHVFGDAAIKDDEHLYSEWERHKREERGRKADAAAGNSELDGIASTLPALRWAEKIQKRAAGSGFDWPDIGPVWAKLDEEVDELKQEVGIDNNHDRMEDELGDILFSVVNLARHLKLNPEQALRRANVKFISRFKDVEKCLLNKNRNMSDCSIQELEDLWKKVK
jgi:MazG family protein